MKKTFILFSLFIVFFFCNNSFSQGFTPPKMILGFTLDGNFATNDAHGTNFTDKNVYGMIWGRGITISSKLSLGPRLKHRVTFCITYNKMVNSKDNKIPFLVTVPDNGSLYSNNTIWTAAAGYEYAFNPRCKSKQYIGISLTGNYMLSSPGSYYQFDPAFRVGAQITTGYEFVLDRNYQTGLTVGLKYNLQNLVGSSNGTNNLNDGSGVGGPGYWRRIGILSLNVGVNFYSGVVPYRLQ